MPTANPCETARVSSSAGGQRRGATLDLHPGRSVGVCGWGRPHYTENRAGSLTGELPVTGGTRAERGQLVARVSWRSPGRTGEVTCLTSLARKLWSQAASLPPAAALHLKVHAWVLHDQHGQGGDVDAGIALSRQEKLVVLVLGEEAEEILKGLKITLGDLGTAGWRGSGDFGV